MRHYCIYTDQLTSSVLADLHLYHAAGIQIHLARVRFELDTCSVPAHAVFYLKHSHLIYDISHETNHLLEQ